MGLPDNDRNRRIAERRAAGETLRAIAKSYGISSERVREICNRQGRVDCLQALGISTRTFNCLKNHGVIAPDEWPHTLPRETLIARLHTVDLAGLQTVKNLGVRTVEEVARLTGKPGRFKVSAKGFVRAELKLAGE